MPYIDSRLIFVFIWIIGCTSSELYILWKRREISFPRIHWAVVVALLVRLIPALILPRGARYEMNVFEQAGRMLLVHENVYLSQVAHPYLPLQIYVFAAAAWMTDTIGGAFPFWTKLPGIVADTAMTVMIYQSVVRMRSKDDALVSGWLFAFNPVMILVTAYQGQYDAIPLLLLVSAWYIFQFFQTHRASVVASSFVLGLGVLSKVFPVILLPILLLRMKRVSHWLLAVSAVMVGPIAAILFYEWLFPGSILPIVLRALNVGAIPGWWGYSAILNVFHELTGLGNRLYTVIVQIGRYWALIAAVIVILWQQRISALSSLLLTVLTLFVFMPNLGLQSLAWLIPLGLLMGSVELGVYTLGAFIHMVVSYWGIHLTDGLYILLPALYAAVIIQLSSLTAWGATVWWWWREVRRHVFSKNSMDDAVARLRSVDL